jgi:hypothetical protein
MTRDLPVGQFYMDDPGLIPRLNRLTNALCNTIGRDFRAYGEASFTKRSANLSPSHECCQPPASSFLICSIVSS